MWGRILSAEVVPKFYTEVVTKRRKKYSKRLKAEMLWYFREPTRTKEFSTDHPPFCNTKELIEILHT
jgi:hypothetical protein